MRALQMASSRHARAADGAEQGRIACGDEEAGPQAEIDAAELAEGFHEEGVGAPLDAHRALGPGIVDQVPQHGLVLAPGDETREAASAASVQVNPYQPMSWPSSSQTPR